MASIVFECQLDEETLNVINDMRKLRQQVLKRLLGDVSGTVKYLIAAGEISGKDKRTQRENVKEEVQSKLTELELRMKNPQVIFSDELEMYLDLLSSEES